MNLTISNPTPNLTEFESCPTVVPCWKVLEAYAEAWRKTKPVADPYFFGYGSGPGLSDRFLKLHQESVPNP